MRITQEEALELFNSDDLIGIGMAANEVRRKKTDPRVATYQIDRNINYTNFCTEYCSFCAFYRPMGHKEGYILPREVIFDKIQETIDLGGTGILFQGGLHPDLKIEWYEDLLRAIKAKFNIWCHCFSAPEITNIAEVSGLSLRDTIARLRDAGLDSIPGGGAEILDDAVRHRISRLKCGTNEWIDVHRTAHQLGIRSNCTMLYGHVESLEDRIEHLSMLRSLQDETGGFLAYIPLAYHPDHNELGATLGREGTATTGFDDLRNLAVGRLYLDNIDHVKTHWIMVTPFLSQTALAFGVDDLEGTVVREKIYHEAGAHTAQGMSLDQILRLIRGARKVPVERDSFYQVVRTFDDPSGDGASASSPGTTVAAAA